jgi:hypothetical protein
MNTAEKLCIFKMLPQKRRHVRRPEMPTLDEILARIPTGAPFTVTNKARLKIWLEEYLLEYEALKDNEMKRHEK